MLCWTDKVLYDQKLMKEASVLARPIKLDFYEESKSRKYWRVLICRLTIVMSAIAIPADSGSASKDLESSHLVAHFPNPKFHFPFTSI